MRMAARSCLLQEPCQNGSILRIEEVATPGQQTTNAYCIHRHFVAAHAPIAFFEIHQPTARSQALLAPSNCSWLGPRHLRYCVRRLHRGERSRNNKRSR